MFDTYICHFNEVALSLFNGISLCKQLFYWQYSHNKDNVNTNAIFWRMLFFFINILFSNDHVIGDQLARFLSSSTTRWFFLVYMAEWLTRRPLSTVRVCPREPNSSHNQEFPRAFYEPYPSIWARIYQTDSNCNDCT